MTEHDLVQRTPTLITRDSLHRQISEAGVAPGDTILVHSSLKAIGWISGGAVALIQALQDCVGSEGTVVMPAHSMQLTDPARWEAPAVPADWVDGIRRSMPAYDPRITPTRNMGTLAELFRTSPGTVRSAHPNTSFAASGRLADRVTSDHSLESPLGEGSPLARLDNVDATILLLGVTFDVCTMLHLAEHRAWPDRPKVLDGAPVVESGVRQWITYEAPPLTDSENFEPFGQHLLESGVARRFEVGIGAGLIMSSRQIVDLAVREWRGRAPFPE